MNESLKAFVIEADYSEDVVVLFATTNVSARRQGANTIGVDFGEVSCRRLPWADQYAGTHIPAKAYVENGWRVGCLYCGDMVYKGSIWLDDDYYERPHEPVYRGENVFCCPRCEAAHDAKVDKQNAKFAGFEKRVREARPDLQYKAFLGAYPCITMTCEFTFEGSQYGGFVRDDGDGTLRWHVANGDAAAWEAYEAGRAKVGAQ